MQTVVRWQFVKEEKIIKVSSRIGGGRVSRRKRKLHK